MEILEDGDGCAVYWIDRGGGFLEKVVASKQVYEHHPLARINEPVLAHTCLFVEFALYFLVIFDGGGADYLADKIRGAQAVIFASLYFITNNTNVGLEDGAFIETYVIRGRKDLTKFAFQILM